MAQFKYVEWLTQWLFEQIHFKFDWDNGNSYKNVEKHSITTESATQIFTNKDALVPLGLQISPFTVEPRFGVLGCDNNSIRLACAFTMRNGKIRIISVRRMSKNERRFYDKISKK